MEGGGQEAAVGGEEVEAGEGVTPRRVLEEEGQGGRGGTEEGQGGGGGAEGGWKADLS